MRSIVLALLAPAAIAITTSASAAVPAPQSRIIQSSPVTIDVAYRSVRRTTVRGPRGGVYHGRTVVAGRGAYGGAYARRGVYARGGGYYGRAWRLCGQRRLRCAVAGITDRAASMRPEVSTHAVAGITDRVASMRPEVSTRAVAGIMDAVACMRPGASTRAVADIMDAVASMRPEVCTAAAAVACMRAGVFTCGRYQVQLLRPLPRGRKRHR